MAKKIIGHTKIELTNVRTGKKEIYEKHNMLTNALPNALKSNPNGDIRASALMPLVGRFLGGIVLYPTTKTENPEDMILLDDFTAYAQCNANSTTDTRRGSWNYTESGPITGPNGEDGYKMVWDFTTSQANGTYSCVGLASPIVDKNRMNFVPTCSFGSVDGYYSSSVSQNTEGQQNLYNLMSNIIAYDEVDGMCYAMKWNSNSSIRVMKGRRPMSKVLLGESSFYATQSSHIGNPPQLVPGVSENLYNYDYRDITLSTALQNGINSGSFRREGGVPYLYIFNVRNTAVNYILMTKINCNDYSVTQQTLTFSGATFYTPSYDVNINQDIYPFIGNYLYAPAKDASGNTAYNSYYKCNITDTSDITKIDFDESITSDTNLRQVFSAFQSNAAGYYIKSPSGTIWVKNINYTSSYSKSLIMIGDTIIATDSRALYNDTTTARRCIPIDNIWICKTRAESSSLYMTYELNNYYLASINNLASSVTKTSEQLMKITYTLTESNE